MTSAGIKGDQAAADHNAIAEILPPLVMITSPPDAERFGELPIRIKAVARAASDQQLKEMQIFLNGRTYGGRDERKRIDAAGGDDGQAEWLIDVPPGRHRIQVRADSENSHALSDPIDIEFKPELPRQPSLYGIAAGVSSYDDETLRLKFAASDAKAFQECFQQHASNLYDDVDVRLIPEEKVTRGTMIQGLEWLKSQMKQGDVGVIFFAGHGVRDDSGVFYFLPVNATPETAAIDALSEDVFKRYVQQIPGRLIMFLDACHTGAIGGDRRRGAERITDDFVRDLLSDDHGVIVMAACMGREYARENDDWEHGAFTKSLVEGASGKADWTGDGYVNLLELDAYIAEQVKQLTGGMQHPVTQKPTTIRDFPLTQPR